MVGSTKLVSAAAATVLALAPGALGRMVTKAPGSTHVYAAATPAPTDAEFTYTVALTPGNQDGLEDKMYEIALSGGSWLTEPQLLEYTKSKAEHVAAVKAHLLNHGAREQDIAEAKFGDALTVKSTVAAANSAWNTRLAHYTHTAQGHTILRATDSYTVPEELHDAITNVHPFTSFPNVRATIPISQRRPNEQRKRNERKAHKPDDQLCNPYSVEPRCLKWYYGADLFKPVPQEGENDILIFGFLGQYVSTSDLDDYVKTETDYPDYRIKIVNAGGSHNDPDNPGAEAALDVDMVAGIVAPLHATFLSYGSSNSSANEPFQEAFDWILNTYNDTNRPGVTTASYVDDASSYTQADAAHLCFTMQKLSSLGTTVLFGSGDNGLNGVQSFEDLKCTTKFNPTSPGSDCGFALIVSGTQLGDPVTNPEVVVDGNSPYGFFAGAGFSNHLARPKYQDEAVTKYLKEINYAHASYYNASGRAYPDVAAIASSLKVELNGSNQPESGTSASTPIFASFLALLNNHRKQRGKGRVGWANPTFYAHPELLKDIISGDVGGCPEPGLTFNATKGWDLASGLGTPKFQKWLSDWP